MYSLMGTFILYTIFIMIYRPYVVPLHNAVIIINSMAITLFMGLLFYRSYFLLTET